ncbi:MAG: hypothetical protein ACFFD4_35410, partial [Candidatus Odinarchaeota archaeon]
MIDMKELGGIFASIDALIDRCEYDLALVELQKIDDNQLKGSFGVNDVILARKYLESKIYLGRGLYNETIDLVDEVLEK